MVFSLPDKVYKERKTGQGIIVYGWCPAKNKAIAMQVDENGRLVIDPEDLDTRYLKLDGSNEMLSDLAMGLSNVLMFGDICLRRVSANYLGVYDSNKTTLHRLLVDEIKPWSIAAAGATLDHKSGTGGSDKLRLRGYTGAAYVTCATVQNAAAPYLDIELAGDIIPISNKSLGSATQYWNQAFVDAILCSNSIDLHPTAGDAVIYFKHDGAANEASLRYDKVNKRLELWIDGAIVGYCNAALGWVNGPP